MHCVRYEFFTNGGPCQYTLFDHGLSVNYENKAEVSQSLIGLVQISIIFTIRITDLSVYLYMNQPANRILLANTQLISRDLRDKLNVKSWHSVIVNIHTLNVRAYMKKIMLF